MKLTAEGREGHQIIMLHADKLDAAGAVAFRQSLDQLDLIGEQPLILDLSHLRFMDSSGVWALTHLCKVAKGQPPLKLISDHRVILHLLSATGIDRFVDVHPSLSAALEPPSADRRASVLSIILRSLVRPFRKVWDRNPAGSQTA
ncbi:MAG: STAS domain-containing protein [Pseudomonadota bacterium]